MQMVNTPLMLLLIAMPAQQNAEFSKAQGVSLLVFGGIAISFKNAMLLAQFHHFNRDRVVRLSKISQPS
jgi:hypothetical protein